jgi:hypothetical protein
MAIANKKKRAYSARALHAKRRTPSAALRKLENCMNRTLREHRALYRVWEEERLADMMNSIQDNDFK